MEPPRAHTQTNTSAHIFSETLAALTAHTLIVTHTRTHAHTPTHLKSMACWQAQLGGGGISFSVFLFLLSFYFLFVSCKLRDIGNRGGGGV